MSGIVLALLPGRAARASFEPYALPAPVNALMVQGDEVWVGTGGAASFGIVNWVTGGQGILVLDALTGDIRRVYDTSTGLRQNDVRAIVADGDGRLWVGTYNGGLMRYDGLAWASSGEGITGNRVERLGVDAEGRVWVDSIGFSSSYDYGCGGGHEYGSFYSYPGIKVLDGETWSAGGIAGFRAVRAAPDGKTWFATASGVVELDGGTFTSHTVATGLPSNDVRDVALAPNGDVWAATGGGAARRSGGVWTPFRVAQGLASDDVRALAFASDGTGWLATAAGLSRYDGATFTSHTTASTGGGLPSSDVRLVKIDERNAVWVATAARGVTRFDGAAWATFAAGAGIVISTVGALAAEPNGTLWVGGDGGLARLTGVTWTSEPGYGAGYVGALSASAGAVWAGGPFGASRYAAGSWTNWPLSGAPWGPPYGWGVYDVATVADGSTWVVVPPAWQSYDCEWDCCRFGPGSCSGSWDYDMYCPGCGDTCYYGWEGGSCTMQSGGGVGRYSDAGGWEGYGMGAGSAIAIAADTAGTVWLATGQGAAYRTAAGATGVLGTADGLAELYLEDVATTQDGSQWFFGGCSLTRRYLDGGSWTTESFPSTRKAVEARTAVMRQVLHGAERGGMGLGTWVANPASADVFALVPGYKVNGNGLQDAGVSVWDGGRWTSYTVRDGLPSELATGAITGADGSVWIATAGGVARWRDLFTPTTRATPLPGAVQLDWELTPETFADFDLEIPRTAASRSDEWCVDRAGDGTVVERRCGVQVYRSLSRDSDYEGLFAEPVPFPCRDSQGLETPCTFVDAEQQIPSGMTRYYRFALVGRQRRELPGGVGFGPVAEHVDRHRWYEARPPAVPRFTAQIDMPVVTLRPGQSGVLALELASADGYAEDVAVAVVPPTPAGLTVSLPGAPQPLTQGGRRLVEVSLEVTDYAQLASCPADPIAPDPLDGNGGRRCLVTIEAVGPNPTTPDPSDELVSREHFLVNVPDPARPRMSFLSHYAYGPSTRLTTSVIDGAVAVEQAVEVAQDLEVRGRIYPPVAGATVTTTFTDPDASRQIEVSSATDEFGYFANVLELDRAGVWNLESRWAGDLSYDPASTRDQPPLSPPAIEVARARTSTTLSSDHTLSTNTGDWITIHGQVSPRPHGATGVDAEVLSPQGAVQFSGNVVVAADGSYTLPVRIAAPGYTRIEVQFEGNQDYRSSQSEIVIPVGQGIGMAVVVAGEGSSSDATAAYQYLADLAVRTLRRRNMPDEPGGGDRNRIWYLHPDPAHDLDGDGTADVDGAPTVAALRAAIESWAAGLFQTHNSSGLWWPEGVNQTPLTVYLIGDTQAGGLRVASGQLLSTAALTASFTTLEQTIVAMFTSAGQPAPAKIPVNLVVEGPASGNFVVPTSKDGRVVITSTDAGGTSYASSGGSVAFSAYFLSRIAAGHYLHPSFAHAQLNLLSNPALSAQRPQLEATGNGVANELGDEVATSTLALEYRPLGDARPRLTNALGDLTLRDVPAASLWVYVEDLEDRVARVDAAIIPPGAGFESAVIVPMTQTPSQPKLWTCTYGGFSGQGLYRVLYIALDDAGNAADPLEKTVTVLDALPPADPTGLMVSAVDAGSVRLSWLPSPSLDAQGYLVYVTAPGGGEILWADVGNVDTAVVPVAASGSYTFRVATYDRVPLHSPGATVQATVTGGCQPVPETCDGWDNDCSGVADDVAGLCADGLACNGAEACMGGYCIEGAPLDCSAWSSDCSAGVCVEPSGCVAQPIDDGLACDDGDSCTTEETCGGGACGGGAPVVCSDGNPCTDDACHPQSGCVFSANTAACDDGNACTSGEACAGGACAGGTSVTCNDGNLCTDDSCDAATGCRHVANSAPCDDGNACTSGESCAAGACGSPSSTMTCIALDACHDPGICNPGTGACTNPNKPNGSGCDDGNACTGGESCQSGVCAPASTVTCTALDACHDAGVCDPATGACSNPNKPNGTSCNDGDGCTIGESCQGGGCGAPVSTVTCTALDACHDAGVCDPATGACSSPAKPDGTTCSDGSACTSGESCQAGVCGSPISTVTCSSLDQCHVAGTCDPATGACSNPTRADGAACTDGSLCTSGESCQAGVCGSPTSTVTCTPLSQCHLAGACDAATGACSQPARLDGQSCDDGLFCTSTDTCQAGNCVGGSDPCPGPDGDGDCGESCDESTDTCTANDPNASACDDTRACTTGDACLAGTCVPTSSTCTCTADLDCVALDPCHADGICDPGLQQCVIPALPDGTPCDDGDACTQVDSCQAGSCAGELPVVCAAVDACHDAGVCDPASGTCTQPPVANGTLCDDGVFCNGTDECGDGTCSFHPGSPCQGADGDDDCAESCDEVTGSCGAPDPDGSVCDDALFCNGADACVAGGCDVHGGPPCSAPDGDADCAEQCDEAADACSAPDPDGSFCDDGQFCNGLDSCGAGVCALHQGSPCPGPDLDPDCRESCDEAADACGLADPDGSGCDDGLFCTTRDACIAGVCSGAGDPCPEADRDDDCRESCDEVADECTANDSDGSACSDGRSCTSGDRCMAGSCQPTADACACAADSTCVAIDACHVAGSCDWASGLCSTPNQVDGLGCDDGDACTAADACSAGACAGGAPSACTALDSCHDPGFCNPATGICSTPSRSDGSTCDDGLFCTAVDACAGGRCLGAGDPCPGPDGDADCSESCDEAMDACAAADPTASTCDDADACTLGDACAGDACVGAISVTCPAVDACREAGVCDPATGTCSSPVRPDGAPCEDGDACTANDTCRGGACVGEAPVVCEALDGCHLPGTCDPQTGVCSDPSRSDGTPCDDGRACTGGDRCLAGRCTPVASDCPCASDADCVALDSCHEPGTCDAATSRCVPIAKSDGADCDDGDACTSTDVCLAGACVGSDPVVCAALDGCHDAGTCDAATGICSDPSRPDGTACDDGRSCTTGDRCLGGACTPTAAACACETSADCLPLGRCYAAGTCDPQLLLCTDPPMPDGVGCDDGDACTRGETCQAGDCGMPTLRVSCTALDECHLAGTCDPATGACSQPAAPDDTPCSGGSCRGGVCTTAVEPQACTDGDERACAVGVCPDGGVQTCTGGEWSACATVPGAESCDEESWDAVAVGCSCASEPGALVWLGVLAGVLLVRARRSRGAPR